MKKRARDNAIPAQRTNVQPSQYFETTDISLVQRLAQRGISPIEVRGPEGDRRLKLYRYRESADVIRRAL